MIVADPGPTAAPDAPSPSAPVDPAATTTAPAVPPAAPDAAAKPVEDAAAKERRDFTARYAQLAQKERLIRQQAEKTRAEILAERQAFEKQRQEAAAAVEETKAYRAAREAAQKDPIKFLQSLGLSYEDVTQFVLNGGVDPVRSVKTELEDFRRQQEELRKADELRRQEEEKQRQAYAQQQQERNIEAWRRGVMDFVRAKGEEYELLNKVPGALDEVPRLIWQHYKQTEAAGTPVLLTEKEAADKVEAQLAEVLGTAATTKKMQEKLKALFTPATPAPAAPATEAKPPSAAPAQPRTISELAASVPSTPNVQSDDRLARAAAAMDRVLSRASAS